MVSEPSLTVAQLYAANLAAENPLPVCRHDGSEVADDWYLNATSPIFSTLVEIDPQTESELIPFFANPSRQNVYILAKVLRGYLDGQAGELGVIFQKIVEVFGSNGLDILDTKFFATLGELTTRDEIGRFALIRSLIPGFFPEPFLQTIAKGAGEEPEEYFSRQLVMLMYAAWENKQVAPWLETCTKLFIDEWRDKCYPSDLPRSVAFVSDNVMLFDVNINMLVAAFLDGRDAENNSAVLDFLQKVESTFSAYRKRLVHGYIDSVISTEAIDTVLHRIREFLIAGKFRTEFAREIVYLDEIAIDVYGATNLRFVHDITISLFGRDTLHSEGRKSAAGSVYKFIHEIQGHFQKKSPIYDVLESLMTALQGGGYGNEYITKATVLVSNMQGGFLQGNSVNLELATALLELVRTLTNWDNRAQMWFLSQYREKAAAENAHSSREV